MKRIPFSAVFPKPHPLSGQHTEFQAKIYMGLKTTTMRAGNWQPGVVQPYYWRDKPYRSPHVVWPFTLRVYAVVHLSITRNGVGYFHRKDNCLLKKDWASMAQYEGLTEDVLVAWFPVDCAMNLLCFTPEAAADFGRAKVESVAYGMSEEQLRHEVSLVRCDVCSHKWVAVRPEGLPWLECPNCANMVQI